MMNAHVVGAAIVAAMALVANGADGQTGGVTTGLAETAGAAAEPIPSDTERRFSAYVSALEVYDRGIPSLHWWQSVRVEPREGPPLDLWKGEMAVLNDGRWMARGEHFNRDGEDGRQHAVKSRYLYDGTRLASYSPTAKRGLLRGEERSDPLSTSLTPLMLIGRALDFEAAGAHGTRLPELLKRTVDRQVDESAPPIVILSGSVKMGGKWFRVSASLDMTRGAMPVRLLREDEAYGVVKEEIQVTNALEVDGVWIPLTGWRELCSFQPASDDVVRALQGPEVVKQAQRLNLDRREDRLAAQRLVRDLAGPEPFRRVALGGGRHVIRVSDPVVVGSEAQQNALLSLPFDEGAKVLDVGTGEMLQFVEGRLTPVEAAAQR